MAFHNSRPPKLRRYHILESISSKTFTPREYQVELLDSARKKNTIICLDTGTGKTFVAIMVIKELAFEIRSALSQGGKRTIFLAPTITLAQQQAKVIRDCTDLSIGVFCGTDPISRWTKEAWLHEIDKSSVLVMTPDIFKMILHHDFLPLSLLNLIVLDECHRAVKNHPYCEIMGCFNTCLLENQPRVLGLSASLLSNKCKPSKLETDIKTLENTLKSSVETASELTVLCKYGSKPKEYLVEYAHYFEAHPAHLSILKYLNSSLVFLDSLNVSKEFDDNMQLHPCKLPRRYLVELTYVVMTLGPWCTLQATVLFLKEIDSMLENICLDEHKNYLVLTRTILLMVQVHCGELLSAKDILVNLVNNIPPKLKELLRILLKYKPEEVTSEKNNNLLLKENLTQLSKEQVKPEKNMNNGFRGRDKRIPSNANSPEESRALCGLIFVRQRVTAFLLNLWLTAVKQNHPDFNFISSSYIIGHGKSKCGSKDSVMVFQKQEDVLQKFRTKVYNLVVATSVVEEGMDIPKCNLVIRFDLPENFRAYVQSKGRARASDSLYVLMVNSAEKEKFIDNLCDFKVTEELLLEKCHRADCIMDEPLLESNVDDIIKPYMPSKEDGCAKVTLSSALALVNRYCAKLPSDTFTRLTARWKIKECQTDDGSIGYQCSIHLPINSPLKKPITGQCMKSIQLAKMAAALKTCENLHKSGELDDNLLPTGKETVKFEDMASEDIPENFSYQGFARPGTTKRRLYYFKKVADALSNSLPIPGVPCYFYVFDMRLTCPIPEEQNTRGRKLHDPSGTSRGFGMITRNPVPSICSFPVFTRSGEVTVSIKNVSSEQILSESEIHCLAVFHRYTFADVLRLEKYPMIYNPEEAESAFFVVPVTKDKNDDYIIDMNFANTIAKEKAQRPGKVSDGERKTFTFVTEDYRDAVVMPWYRNLDKPQFFYVAEICSYLTPKSDFPDMGYQTFAAYYERKYNVTIMNHDQPLLDVDHTSARLNLLTPRYVNRKGVTLPTSSEQTKKTKRENLQQKQILIPELCTIHPFPAYLWRKAVCLPCILYRVNSLLLAEQLRLTVAKSISVGIKDPSANFKWPPLDFGWTLADVVGSQVTSKDMKETKQKRIGPARSKNGLVFLEAHNNSIETNPHSLPNHSTNFPNQESENTGSTDFEIDVFDPSKLNIPDEDSLLDQELCDIDFADLPISFGNDNFSSNASQLFPIWQPAPDPQSGRNSPSSPQIRYGSPSNFEDTGWDSEWDADGDDAPFLAINYQGLGYISAPGVFNMESLSMDLASCKENDLWDSLDEESLASDAEYVGNTPALNDNSDLISSKGNNANLLEMWESNLLSHCCDPKNYTCMSSLENCPGVDELIADGTIKLKEIKRKEIKFLYKVDDTSIQLDLYCSYNGLTSAINEIENYSDVFITESKDLYLSGLDAEYVTENAFLSDNGTENALSEDSKLAFGDLLPNRDLHELKCNDFRVSFDDSPDLSIHPGPSPSIILQAFTMSNANDGINLERLETVGDSFLKYAITVYLYCTYPDIHEGKLSYLRSKQISNLNLYKLGRRKGFGELMVASKFEPNDNYLPPNYIVPKGLEEALIESGMHSECFNLANLSDLTQMSEDEIRQTVIAKTKSKKRDYFELMLNPENAYPLVPYNLLTQHSIPDKSIADCVEALIGAYLVSCGTRGALLFMSWLGLRVLPILKDLNMLKDEVSYGYLKPPPSPMLSCDPRSQLKLEKLLSGYDAFEAKIGYSFKDRSYLLQAFTHASYYYNRLTDCYQRLEFLGDAVLDYLITRHLYEDPKKHSPGTLTDLRSALVNNTFFASLAVKYDFHKYFKAISPSLFNVINKFVLLKENNSALEDYEHSYYLEEDECEEMEDVEVPKALGDIFESVAGAIFLDSNMSLDTVWRVYYAMMKPEIEYFSTHVPKSPIRELLELEPQTAKFEKAEMTLNGKVRVRVDVFGKGKFIGIGRNKRIAKCTAAKRALRVLKKIKSTQ